MDIEVFLKTVVEGYLLHDLESMEKVTVPPKTVGALGYSMMATTLAGIELLGSLLIPDTVPFDPGNGNKYFNHYWKNYLVKEQRLYTGLGDLFRQLLRHGIVHTFLAKPGIIIEKGTGRSVTIDRTRQELYIDCLVFFRDFQKSYDHHVRPIIDGTAKAALTSVANMQSRLDSMLDVYMENTKKAFDSLRNLDPSLLVIRTANIYPTGSSRDNEYYSPVPTGMIFTSPPDNMEGLTFINPDSKTVSE